MKANVQMRINIFCKLLQNHGFIDCCNSAFRYLFRNRCHCSCYYFEKKRGMWMLEAINLREMEKGENEDFVEFYTRFVTDSLYQSEHIANPLQFVTIDPDDPMDL